MTCTGWPGWCGVARRPKLLDRTGLGLVCEFDTYCDDEAVHLVWLSRSTTGAPAAATLVCGRHMARILLSTLKVAR